MATKAEADQERDDLRGLLALPAFRRFLFRIVEASGICGASYGSEEHILRREGARALGSDILGWVSAAHPMPEHPALPLNALLLIFSEESQSNPNAKEPGNGRSARYNRNAELDGDDEPERA